MKSLINKLFSQSRLLKTIKCNNQLMILNYHRLHDTNKNIYFDDGVYGPDAKRFKLEMEWLKQETHIISEDELFDILYNNKKMNRACSMVTFDDGYVDNYNIAYPILKQLSIPAIYFIPTKHINERSLGWWDITAYLIKNTKLVKTHFRGKEIVFSDKKKIIADIIIELKKMEASRVEGYINELSTSLKVPIPSLELQGNELMTWDQIKEVSQNGITIGSHTHEHVILSRQTLRDLRFQIKKSKDILEEKIGQEIRSISYPVGGYDHFDLETKKVSESLGFKIGFSFLTGVNRFENIDPFDVKRGTSQPEWTNLDMALAFPDRVFQQERVTNAR
ncbi:MAG: polysaccharide deacetylase family protein [Bacteriovorax sp.]|nr:polysaccharide deacetylase family protein [Bacteriovorax sp.]